MAPLPRFLAIVHELRSDKSWTDDWELLRWAAIPLTQADGDPQRLAKELRETIRELKRRVKWWKDGISYARTFVAGSLVASGTTPAEFLAEVERVRTLFRQNDLRREQMSEALTVLVLREAGRDGHVDASHVQRMGQLYERVKKDHTFLRGSIEYPTLALLATTADDIDAIGTRVEALYVDLRARGFRSPGALLSVPHLLYFHPDPDSRACTRFEAIWNAFKAEGLRMQPTDYDEIALLTFAPGAPASIVKRVLAHRASIDELRPKPGRNPGFSLACATTFLELTGRAPFATRLSRVQAAYQVRFVVASRQAAAVAAAS